MDTKSLDLLQRIYSTKRLALYIPSCIIIKPQSLSENININITDYKIYCRLLRQYNQYPYRKRTMRLEMRSYWRKSKSVKTRRGFIEEFSENINKISIPQIWSTKPIYEQDCFGVYNNGTFTKF